MLRRLLSGPRRAAKHSEVDVLLLAGSRQVEAVGESHYQRELGSICGGKRPEGYQLEVTALLTPELDNPYDDSAVAVHVQGVKVGYLERPTAAALHAAIRRLAGSAGKPVGCRGQIVGGWDDGRGDEGHFGIRLFFDDGQLLGVPSTEVPHTPTTPNAPATERSGRLWSVGGMPDGVVHDRHYTDWVETVTQLKRTGEIDDAIELLRQCADAAEDEAQVTGLGVAPWYFEQLAICFRKQKDYASEVAVLERYIALPHAPGAGPHKMQERLEKARQLIAEKG